MTTPIIESIAANVETTLDGITVANGYNQTIVAYRPRRIDFSDTPPADLVALIIQTEAEFSDENRAQTHAQWRQYFEVYVEVIDSDTATTTIDTRCNQVAADIMKALMVDPRRGKSDGSVIDTRIEGYSFIDPENGNISGVHVVFSVLYRTSITNPYSL